MSVKPFRGFRPGHHPTQIRPPSIALDRFGKVIEQGHLVMFHPQEDLIFEIADVRPVLNPQVPQGQSVVQVTLLAQFPVQFFAAQPNRGMVIVGESQARLDARAANNGAGEELTPDQIAVAEAGPVAPTGIVLTDAPETPATEDAAAGPEIDPTDPRD